MLKLVLLLSSWSILLYVWYKIGQVFIESRVKYNLPFNKETEYQKIIAQYPDFDQYINERWHTVEQLDETTFKKYKSEFLDMHYKAEFDMIQENKKVMKNITSDL